MFCIAVRHQVVVLHHGPVVKSHAVVGAAAVGHGGFFQKAVAGRRFAGVQNAGAGVGDGLYVFPGEGSHTGKALDEVQGRALRTQNGPGGPFNEHDYGAGRHGFPVVQVYFHLQAGVHLAEYFRRHVDAGQNAFLAGRQDGPGRQVFGNEISGGYVARAEVFG